MGRRRRRVIRIVKKKLPTVFICPRCGEEAVRVTIAKDTGHATVLCALCNLKDEFPAHPAAQPIDVYSYFTDRFYGVKDPRAIIPREREISQTPIEEPTQENIAAPESPQKTEMESTPEHMTRPAEDVKPTGQSQIALESSRSIPEGGDKEETSSAVEASTESPSPNLEVEKKESEEESEPFADILENKDKKRYSSQPLPQQSTEPSS